MPISRVDLPPGPFNFLTTALPGEHDGTGHVYLIDGNQRKIASLWGRKEEKIALADLIIEAEHMLAGNRSETVADKASEGKSGDKGNQSALKIGEATNV